MPPRHAYWTIILEGKPTAFRTHTREELLPTFKQLQSRHADTQMKWFARGRLWESPEEERAAARRRTEERRGPSWRPGGTHEDPRERFSVPRDVKRRRFAAKLRRDGSMNSSSGPTRGDAGEGGRRQAPGPRPKAPRAMTDRLSKPRPPSAPSGPRTKGPQGSRPFRKPGPGRGGGRSGSGGRGGGRPR